MFKKKRENEYKSEVAKNMDLAVAMKWEPPSHTVVNLKSGGWHYVKDDYADVVNQLAYCLESNDRFDNMFLQLMVAGQEHEEATVLISDIVGIYKVKQNDAV